MHASYLPPKACSWPLHSTKAKIQEPAGAKCRCVGLTERRSAPAGCRAPRAWAPRRRGASQKPSAPAWGQGACAQIKIVGQLFGGSHLAALRIDAALLSLPLEPQAVMLLGPVDVDVAAPHG